MSTAASKLTLVLLSLFYRKLVSAACLLLAAKISSDLKKQEVKHLIDVSDTQVYSVRKINAAFKPRNTGHSISPGHYGIREVGNGHGLESDSKVQTSWKYSVFGNLIIFSPHIFISHLV